jgi:putative acetyltransferase
MRQATLADFDFVYELYVHPTINPFMMHEIISKEAFLPIFTNDLLKRDYFWIFSQDGKDAGMCSVILGEARMKHVAAIRTLAIHPSMQGKKLGQTIMQKVMDFLKEKNIKRVTLGLEADNPRALKLYNKCAFVVDGILSKNFRRANDDEYIDHIMMSKWIGD